MATDAEPPNDHEDELQLALALSLSEAEAASARPPPRPVSSPRSPPSPALSEVVEVLTPPTRASAPPPSPSFTEARRPPPPPPLELFDAEALADAALAEVLPPAAPPLPPREPEAMPSPESKPTSPRDGGPRRQSLLKSARRSIRRSLGIPKPAKASPAEVARLRRQAAAAEAEATRLRGALEASTPLDESTECQVCMARAKDTALVPVWKSTSVSGARQFFTTSFLGDDAADLARSSGEEPASSRRRVDGVEDDAKNLHERAVEF